MAPRRTFDYDLLKELVKQHPDWSYHQYAQTLTRDMRNKTGDPGYPVVLSNAVAAVISRYKDRWAEQGLIITDQRVPVYKELIPERWRITPDDRMATELRHLRTLARLRRGEGASGKDARQALQFERRLRDNREVVDVTPRGRVVVRPAMPWELDSTGNLVEIVAQVEPVSTGNHR